MKLSLIIPCYNEEASLAQLFEALSALEVPVSQREYIFVNDGSSDGTLAALRQLADKHPEEVHYISFSRNFGKEAAILAGLKAATGDFVTLMDADLQDPPELLGEMFRQLTADAELDVVAARRTTRKGEGALTSLFSRFFYWLINRISDTTIVSGVRDFRLMRRAVVDAILQLTESNRFSKGLFSWVGFNVSYIDYENHARVAGQTKWSFWSKLKYALDGFVNFSDAALNLATYMGFTVVFLDVLAVILLIIRQVIFHDSVSGWTSMTAIILLCFGLTLLMLGIIGKYIATLFMEIKHRPVYIIKEKK